MVDKKRFYEGGAGGAKRSAPAALRNREPIADVLAEWLPASGTVLEIASGTGEHAVHFAGRFANIIWQPSDVDPAALKSIEEWRAQSGLGNIRPPIRLDSRDSDWVVTKADAVFSANMVHISPWSSAIGLVEGGARILLPGGTLILYGPWLKDDIETAPSNLVFDADLRARDPAWGLRRVEDFASLAASHGFEWVDTRSMPANNLMLKFVRSGTSAA